MMLLKGVDRLGRKCTFQLRTRFLHARAQAHGTSKRPKLDGHMVCIFIPFPYIQQPLHSLLVVFLWSSKQILHDADHSSVL